MGVSKALVLALVSAGLFGSSLHATTWLQVSSGNFEIATDAGESAARELVIALEQFDGALARLNGPSGLLGTAGAPLRIYLLRSEQEFSEFRRESWSAGYTLTAGHRTAPTVVLFAGPKARETMLHEYVHVLIHEGEWKLPDWFEEGLAELYGHSVAGRDSLSIGGRVPELVARLTGRPVTPLSFDKDRDPQSYYAASWGMVHMLLMEPSRRAQTEQMLTNGVWDWKPLAGDLQTYMQRPMWPETQVSAPRPSALQLRVKTIGSLEAEFMLAALLVDAGKNVAAQKRYQRIAATHPKEAAGAEAAGFAALADGRTTAAREAFRRAVQLQSTRAQAWWELAFLEREAGASWTETKPLLEGASRLGELDFQAAYLLGVHESDEGEFPAAVAHLGIASKIAPGRADVLHAYAMALSKAGRTDEARAAAKRAMRVATSPEWEQAAAELLASFDRASTDRRPPVRRKPEVVTSPAWERPAPDAVAEGRFVDFVCQADPPLLKVELADGKIVELRVTDPKQVNIPSAASGESSMTLKCGPQDRRPIRVGYRRSDGTVLEVKFPPST